MLHATDTKALARLYHSGGTAFSTAPGILATLNQRCKRSATVYAASNDRLHVNQPVSDEAILREVLETGTRQEKIPKSKWREPLDWMRLKGHILADFDRDTQSTPWEG